MNVYRKAAKPDSSEREIVAQLRDFGIEAWIIRQPVYALLRFWCRRHRDFCWQPMEIQVPGGKKPQKDRVDHRQIAKSEFIRETLTPVATSFEEVISKLNQRHNIGVFL